MYSSILSQHLQLGNVVTGSFSFRSNREDELRERIQLLQHKLKAARYQPIRRSFAIWLSRLLRVKFKEKSIPEYQELTEVNAMLAERLTDWTLQLKKEGEKIGEKRAVRLSSKQIRLKYGEFPSWAANKIEQADTEQLEN